VPMKGTGRWLGASAWRGSAQSAEVPRAREIFHLNAARTIQQGRWFPFQHPELGAKEIRRRVDGSPQIAGVLPNALHRGEAAQVIRIFGANLSAIQPRDLNLGAGIAIAKVTESTADFAAVEIVVSPEAKIGTRDVRLGALSLPGSVAVYNKVDYIRVSPEKALARLGGVRAVKRFIQFEAHAFSNGPDGIPGNADDLDLGMVKASWSLGESLSSPTDDDTKYVGTINQDGLFMPAQEGPNPERPRSTNNAGDIWVNAAYTPEGSSVALKTRAYLLISIPAYRELISQ
jgi:quinohemoprotein amine dehydrogenase